MCSTSICRLCMFEDTSTFSQSSHSLKDLNLLSSMISILSVTEEKKISVSIIQLLKQTNPKLDISQNDPLPKFACKMCIQKLVDFFNFQEQCLKSEEKLKLLFNKKKQGDSLDKERRTSVEINDIESISIKIDIDEEILSQYNVEDNDPEGFTNDIKDEDIQSCSDFSIELVWTDEEADDNDDDIWAKKDLSTKKTKYLNKNNKIGKEGTGTSLTCFESYQCDICNRVLKTKKTLIKHRMLHGKEKLNKKKKATCNICHKEYLLYGLKEHMLTHTGLKPYLCSECGKSFSASGSLRQHLLRHKNDRRFQCADCPRNFPCRSDLLSHSHVHNAAPKNHICDVCGNGFSKAYLLKKHKMYHNNERLYSCEFCEKSFYTAEKCRRHVRIHTGEKPYRCKFCEKAYCQSNELTKHLRCHLGENIYQCELCPQRCPNVKSLREHFATHKDDDEETREHNLLALKHLELKGVFSK